MLGTGSHIALSVTGFFISLVLEYGKKLSIRSLSCNVQLNILLGSRSKLGGPARRYMSIFWNQLGFLTDNELEALCVPLQKCISVRTGPVDDSTLSVLETRGFDQAPVYDRNGINLLGLIDTSRLRELRDTGQPVEAEDLEVSDKAHWFPLGPFVTVLEILKVLSQRRAVFVVRESSATEHGHGAWDYGLLTISDLNRQPLRAALYALLSELESGMAVLIESTFDDPWVWVKSLNEEHQVRILGYWELTKRRGVDVGPIAATTLSQLIQVAAKNKDVLMRLGYSKRTEFDNETGVIPELRNCVMHPVRPLVLSQADVQRVLKAVTSVIELHKRVKTLINRSPKPEGGT